MKKLGKIKLNQLSKAEMKKRELTNLKGGKILGTVCVTPCGCEYAGEQCDEGDDYWGGASVEENHDANGAEVQD